LENIFGGRTCTTLDIIHIKMDFVENFFEGNTWKIKVPNYDVGTIVMTW
jgi:hypothetical protein